MIATVVVAVFGAWLLLSVVTTAACAVLARGGRRQENARGYARVRVVPEPRRPVAHR
jgi:hypothetical protein